MDDRSNSTSAPNAAARSLNTISSRPRAAISPRSSTYRTKSSSPSAAPSAAIRSFTRPIPPAAGIYWTSSWATRGRGRGTRAVCPSGRLHAQVHARRGRRARLRARLPRAWRSAGHRRHGAGGRRGRGHRRLPAPRHRPPRPVARQARLPRRAGREKAEKFLVKNGFDEDFARRVADCVRTHRFRKGDAPQSIEAQILYDADKIDVCGATGIARTLLYQGRSNGALYAVRPDGSLADGLGEKGETFFRRVQAQAGGHLLPPVHCPRPRDRPRAAGSGAGVLSEHARRGATPPGKRAASFCRRI